MSEFKNQIIELKNKLDKHQHEKFSESETEAYFIRPLLRALGWNPSNPELVKHQYWADPLDTKTGRVDYALLKDGRPIIFVEGKKFTKN